MLREKEQAIQKEKERIQYLNGLIKEKSNVDKLSMYVHLFDFYLT